jgi:hypothetical protein
MLVMGAVCIPVSTVRIGAVVWGQALQTPPSPRSRRKANPRSRKERVFFIAGPPKEGDTRASRNPKRSKKGYDRSIGNSS